jgi:glycine cleavage system H lipoate-binding protein
MSNIPSDLKYAKSHEWVRVSGDTATVGITDHAQHELTDVVFVELPALNRQVKSGDACAVAARSSRQTRPSWTTPRSSTPNPTAPAGSTKSS